MACVHGVRHVRAIQSTGLPAPADIPPERHGYDIAVRQRFTNTRILCVPPHFPPSQEDGFLLRFFFLFSSVHSTEFARDRHSDAVPEQEHDVAHMRRRGETSAWLTGILHAGGVPRARQGTDSCRFRSGVRACRSGVTTPNSQGMSRIFVGLIRSHLPFPLSFHRIASRRTRIGRLIHFIHERRGDEAGNMASISHV